MYLTACSLKCCKKYYSFPPFYILNLTETNFSSPTRVVPNSSPFFKSSAFVNGGSQKISFVKFSITITIFPFFISWGTNFSISSRVAVVLTEAGVINFYKFNCCLFKVLWVLLIVEMAAHENKYFYQFITIFVTEM